LASICDPSHFSRPRFRTDQHLKSKTNSGSAADWSVIFPNSMLFDQLVSAKLGLTGAPWPGKFVKSSITQPCIARFRWDSVCRCITGLES